MKRKVAVLATAVLASVTMLPSVAHAGSWHTTRVFTDPKACRTALALQTTWDPRPLRCVDGVSGTAFQIYY